MRKDILLYGLMLLFFAACTYDAVYQETALDRQLRQFVESASPTGSVSHYVLPDHTDLSSIPQDPKNELTPAKVALGQYLFFETGLGLNAAKPEGIQTYSCGSCHIPTAGFRPGRMQGIADGGVGYGENGESREMSPNYEASEADIQGIRPLTVLNAAFVTNTFWSGQFGSTHVNEGTEHLWGEETGTQVNELGFQGIESQNIEGVDLHRMHMDEELAEKLGYKALFDIAFADLQGEERYSKKTTALALSAYIRSLITDQAPFQEWLKGDGGAMTAEEKRGGVLFFSKANCYSCHTGPSFNAVAFYGIGVNDLYQAGGLFTDKDDIKNFGRGGFTGENEDMFKFKVPQLYNLKHAPFYFHGSSKVTLDEVIDYFDIGMPENENVPSSQISNNFRPIGLTASEKADLKAFLENALYDPYTDRYVPPYVKSGNCFPNNDPKSQIELGCK